MGWLLLRTVILTPLVLAIAILVLLAIGVHVTCHKLFRRHTCTVNS